MEPKRDGSSFTNRNLCSFISLKYILISYTFSRSYSSLCYDKSEKILYLLQRKIDIYKRENLSKKTSLHCQIFANLRNSDQSPRHMIDLFETFRPGVMSADDFRQSLDDLLDTMHNNPHFNYISLSRSLVTMSHFYKFEGERSDSKPQYCSVKLAALAQSDLAKEYKSIIWEYIKQEHSPFMNVWYDKYAKLNHAMSSRQLANIIHAFAALDIVPRDEFWNLWFLSVCAKLPSFNAQELSNTIYSIAKLNFPQNIEKSATTFFILWCNVAILKMDTFKPQELVSSLYAFSTLESVPKAKFLNAWCSSVIRFMEKDEFNVQDVVNSFHALGRLKLRPPQEFMDLWCSISYRKMESFSDQSLTNTIYAFGALRITPPLFWIEQWFLVVSRRDFTQFTTQGLSNMIYAFGKLRLLPPPTFRARYFDACEYKLAKFSAQELSNCMFGLSDLNLHPPTFFSRLWCDLAKENFDSFTNSALCNIIPKLVILDIDLDRGFLNSWMTEAKKRRVSEKVPKKYERAIAHIAKFKDRIVPKSMNDSSRLYS